MVSLTLQSFKDQCQNQTVLVAMDNSNSGGLHKQGGTHSAEMCTLLWKIMTWCHHYQITLKARHIPGCLEFDGRPSVQVIPSAVNRMVTASTGVQTDLSKVVHPSCRSICHSSEPQSSTVCISSPRPNAWDIDTLNINWSGLTAYAYPLTALLHRVIQIRQRNCLIIVIAPGWPWMPWFWDLVKLSTEIPLQLPVSTNSSQRVTQLCFHSNPQHLNLHAWCLGVDSSKNKASLWRWQRELLPFKGHP